MFVQKFLRDYRSTIVPTIVDVDVAAATGALAATFETSGRGIIYEHQPSSISAQHLTTKLKASLDQALKQDHTLTNQNPAVVLRRTERAAQDAQKFFDADRTSCSGFNRSCLSENYLSIAFRATCHYSNG